jgi:hypothetical protein
VSAERRIIFRILASKAEAVRLSGSDIPGNGQGASKSKFPSETPGGNMTISSTAPPSSRRMKSVENSA